MAVNPAGLGFLDVACGMPLGWNDSRPPAPRAASLDDACALAWSGSFGRGPCHIPFSGGRESSMWLATATRYARQNGYDDPIPMTLGYAGLATTEELRLQDRIVAHLGLSDWERVEPDADLDLIGPVAGATLARTGPLWPPNAYLMAPLVELARDGVFVFATGLIDFFDCGAGRRWRRRSRGTAGRTSAIWRCSPGRWRPRPGAPRHYVGVNFRRRCHGCVPPPSDRRSPFGADGRSAPRCGSTAPSLRR